jgi:hypothetical protein
MAELQPNAARNEQSQEAFKRLVEVQSVLVMVQRGTLDERQAIQQIEEIATGAADRIVRIGPDYRPDVLTSREGDR